MAQARRLLFYDDFNGDTLDTAKWSISKTPASDTAQKRYTDRPENIRVVDGDLILTARREAYQGGSYTSASISTEGKFSFCYGRMEIRARLPYGEGTWPAFWTLGDDYGRLGDEKGWPYAGEIDVMEFIGIGGEADKHDTEGRDAGGCEVYIDNRMGNNRSTCNLHWGRDRQCHESCGTEYCLPEGILADDYHVFSAEWTPERIEWFVDDVKIHTVDIRQASMMEAFHKPHWLIVNLGLVEGWGPQVKDITPFPQSYRVDYVKVFAPKDT